MAEVESAASRNARAGAQEGALKGVDIAEAMGEGGASDGTISRTRGGVTRTTKVVPLYQRTFVRPGKLLAPPIPAARHVMLAMTGGAVIFFIAGGRFEELLERVRGQTSDKQAQADATNEEAFKTLMGWGVMLTILIFMADTGTLAPLAIGFSWLIFLSILLMYGERAANNVLSMMGQPYFAGAGGEVVTNKPTVPDTAVIPD